MLGQKGIYSNLDNLVKIYGDMVYIHKDAQIEAFVVIDAQNGPVYIDRDVIIYSHTRIEGPAYIGPLCRIVGAKIREGTSINEGCRIGGEVEESIFHKYVNKYHSGFLGHSYIGEWVNLGALTTNSDLKNNYSNVKVPLNGILMDTGEIKVGCCIGDHSKTGIGTLINTGSIIGVSVNLFGGGLPPKYIPSFLWGGSSGFDVYILKKAIDTARRVMARRNVKMSNAYLKLYQKIYEITESERQTYLKK